MILFRTVFDLSVKFHLYLLPIVGVSGCTLHERNSPVMSELLFSFGTGTFVQSAPLCRQGRVSHESHDWVGGAFSTLLSSWRSMVTSTEPGFSTL